MDCSGGDIFCQSKVQLLYSQMILYQWLYHIYLIFKIKLIIIKVKQLPKIHLDVCVTKAKSMLHTFTKTDMKSSLVELKCFHPKSNKNRNTIISMKQRKIMTASKCRMNSTKMLNCSLIGPTKNLHVKTGVIKILLTIIILHICANSLFFNDLFLKVIHPQNCN